MNIPSNTLGWIISNIYVKIDPQKHPIYKSFDLKWVIVSKYTNTSIMTPKLIFIDIDNLGFANILIYAILKLRKQQ